MSTPVVLQTPQMEEKNLKRNRDGASSSGMDTSNVQYEASQSKRPRVNPVSEQEDTKGLVEITNTELDMSKGTIPSVETQEPSISQTQMLERQLSVEGSSFNKPTDRDMDIKDRFKEIKMRNEKLKAQSYAQYLKLTPTNQTRLMSAFDIKKGKMQMSFIKPTVQQPRTSVDFKKIDFEVLARDIHPIDQIESQIGWRNDLLHPYWKSHSCPSVAEFIE